MPYKSGEGEVLEDDVLAVPESPTNISTTSRPDEVEPSSFEDEPLPVTDDELSGADEEEAPLELDPKYRKSFEGLEFLGKVQREFKWAGHTFVIRSPYIDELLEAGQLHQPYVNTVADIKAWQSLIAAAIIVSVDGKPLPIPLGDETSDLTSRFQYIIKHWYPFTLDEIYSRYLKLDAEIGELIGALGKV